MRLAGYVGSAVVAAAVVATAVVALRPAATAARNEAAIDAILSDALHAWDVPGAALAIVRDDQIIYLKGFGVRELGKPDPVTPDTVFPLASCTKAFTTTAMAMLADAGNLAWDDPVRKHVPYFHLSDPAADALVTLRDLVSHRTGVGANDLLWYRAPWSREEAIRRVGKVPLAKPFRSGFQYQTTMFTTAGQAVELTSGMKWEDFVRQRIFEPLGMTHSCFTTPAALQNPDHASPHRKDAHGVRAIPLYTMEQPEPAGSIHSTARDLCNWLRLQLSDGTFDGKRLVSAEQLGETHKPQTIIPLEGEARDMNPDTHFMCYGMAWVLQDYRGFGLVSHAGIIDGFRAHITLVPEARLGIVLLNNLDRTQMNLAASNALVDHLLGLPSARNWNEYIAGQVRKREEATREHYRQLEADRRPDTRPSHQLKDYTGTFEHPAYGTAEVSLRDSQLQWKWGAFEGELQHYHFDTFVLASERLGPVLVTFTLNPDGQVAALKMDRPFGVEFSRVERE